MNLAQTVLQMAAAGLSANDIARFVAKVEGDRLAKAAEKKRAQRANRPETSRDVQGTSGDKTVQTGTSKDVEIEPRERVLCVKSLYIPPLVPPSSNEPVATATRKRDRAKARSSISEDQQPAGKDREHAAEIGMSQVEMRSEWPKFRDYHRSKGSMMADWSAAWRTWCGNWQTYRKDSGRPMAKQGISMAEKAAIPVAGKVYAMRDTDEWAIAAELWREAKGQYPPTDDKGGWWFPAEYFAATAAA